MQYGFILLCMAVVWCTQRKSLTIVSLVNLSFLAAKEKEKSGLACIQIDQIYRVILLYLSPEGLDVITHSKYSLAAMESSTLFTSLVKVPSTCLLLNASSLLCVSDLSMYDIMCHLSQYLSPHRITHSGKWSCLCDHFVIGWNACQK